jgi:hypothetical protein
MRYGLSGWKARRWIAAAHALLHLPRIADSLATGRLGIDKVVELTRFARPETEADLILWAVRVSCGAIRRKGDLFARAEVEETDPADRDRRLSYGSLDDGRRFGLEAELPAAEGAVVARAIERLAESLPTMPGEEDACFADARRADALVAMCSSRIAADPDPDRATVVVHAQAGMHHDAVMAEIEGGPAIGPETLRRLLCADRVQTVIEDAGGSVLGLGRMTREPSEWMVRQLRCRDKECRFPGCGPRRFTQAHHIVWWRHGGRTDLDNLVLICSFHHKLVHEYGWRLQRDADGTPKWFHPDGTRYRAGPSRETPAWSQLPAAG